MENSDTMTVGQIAASAGDRNASAAEHSNLPVFIRTETGKLRKVTGSAINGSALVLTTGK